MVILLASLGLARTISVKLSGRKTDKGPNLCVSLHWGPAEVVPGVRIRSCCLLIGWGSYRAERVREEEEKIFIFQSTVGCC